MIKIIFLKNNIKVKHQKYLDEKKERERIEQEEKKKEESEKNTSEESEKDKIYNDVNFWKAEIVPNDEIMSAVLNDLD